jgi:hypothetical protein
MVTINVAKDFSRYPTGRLMKNGTTSGEEFREKFLLPNINIGKKMVIELDGTIGYGSSFLEEAFGGLVRRSNEKSEKILELLELKSIDTELIAEIHEYIKDAVKK